jgi:hypothetical protein
MATLIISPGTIAINSYEYHQCKITSVVIPDSVTKIGICAFSGCSILQSLIVPDNVIEIGPYAFDTCSSLQSLTIPASVTKLGYNLFYGCLGPRRAWNKSKCEMIGYRKQWVYLRGSTPPLKELEKWTFALHWHWKTPDHITPEQVRLFTLGLHCLSVPIELCQAVFSYIPRT